jgi:tetratricopeptide (TPR) repeat protein
VSLRKAIGLDKNNVNAFVLLGLVEVQEGSLEKAIASSYEWIRENPKDVTAYVLTGSLEETRGDWRKAQDLYNKALQIQPNSAIAENNLAYSMLENGGNTDVALSLAQSAHSQAPTAASIDDTLAWAYYHKGLYKMSIEILQDALKIEPDSAPYHYHIGLAYSKLGNVSEAKLHFQHALAVDPKSAEADLVRKELQQLGG